MELILSCHVITYNQKNFIRECLDSVLMQQTNFRFEVVVGDDNSTDGTREILIEYANNFPDIIRLNLRDKRGEGIPGKDNFVSTFQLCRGKYISLCDGDDYWTDPNKLQKQIDFLEANDDYAICFHRVNELEDGKALSLSNLISSVKEETYTIEDLASGNFIHTASVVFRNGLRKKLPAWFIKSPAGDYPLHMLNARHGKIKYFPEPMAVYRFHGGSIWSSTSYITQIKKLIVVLNYLIEEFEGDKSVVDKLSRQKFKYLSDIINDLMNKEGIVQFNKSLIEGETVNPGFLKYWLEDSLPKLMEHKMEVAKKLDLILRSTTYRLLKRLGVFK